MILILASRFDRDAPTLAARWATHGAQVLTPAGLSVAGWRHTSGSPDGMAMVAGSPVPTAAIRGVLTRLPAVAADELPHIAPEDRAYVAAEMSAFLCAWLAALPCPVVNRAAPGALAGPGWWPERWAHTAARLGIPTRPLRRATCGPPPDPGPPPALVTVVGERCLGETHAALRRHARRLAAAAGAQALAVAFSGPGPDAVLLGAAPWVDVADPAVADALAELLTGNDATHDRRLAGTGSGMAVGAPKVAQSTAAPRRGLHPSSFIPHPSPLALLWGVSGEGPLAIVGAELDRLGAPWLLLDQRAILETAVELEVGAEVAGALRLPGATLDLAAVGALYARPYQAAQLPAVARAGPGSPAWRHAHAVEAALLAWSEVTPALVVNRGDAAASNSSKPYQLELIRRAGLAVPETLVTTDPGAALAFWERHGAVVYKSVSGVRSIVRRLAPADRARLADLAACPTQLQRYIPGRDYRAHVVGAEVLACAIEADGADYRYADGVRVEACALPDDVAAACVAVTAALGLSVAGVDLRCTPEGEWYCLEVNGAPGFSYYEEATGQPIGAAIARLLAGACGAGRRAGSLERRRRYRGGRITIP